MVNFHRPFFFRVPIFLSIIIQTFSGHFVLNSSILSNSNILYFQKSISTNKFILLKKYNDFIAMKKTIADAVN